MKATVGSGIELHQKGRFEEAEQVYLAVLAEDQGNASALHFLGVLRHQQGQSLQGIQLLRRAIELRPDYFDAVNNLGNILQQLGASVDAIDTYRRALDLRPDHPGASHNLGIVLRKVKRFEDSATVHERNVAQWPEKLEHYYALASAYKDMARFEDAVATLRKALSVRAEPDGYRRLGHMLYGLRRNDEAAAVYRAWLCAEPDSPVAKHMLSACTGEDVPARAGDAFVASVFDGFADTFDDVLKRLEYRAPALVGEALRRIADEPRGVLDVADAGCGTGLLAEFLRPYARRLVGVDLSSKMLEKAAKRGIYDELLAAELTWYLGSMQQAFDVVASSDTLVYFGELGAVFAAAAASLRPGGRLCFTLEHANDLEAPAGYRLHPHGRYSHTEAYVRKSLAAAGFGSVEIEQERLRWEGRGYVAGLVIAARLEHPRQRPAPPADTALRDNLVRAIALHRQGELGEVEPVYLAALQADERNADALHHLGDLRLRQGRLLAALNLVRRAIDARPDSADAYATLGEICRQLGLITGAAAAYRRALELQPHHADAARNLPSLLETLEGLEEAAEAHRRALEDEPGNPDHLYALAQACRDLGRNDEALAALRNALATRPEAQAFRRLGAMLCGMGRLDEAAATYQAWLRAEPGNAVAQHLLAACTGEDVPQRASDAFVMRDFDRFAETFDEVLGKLEYRAPALVAMALRRSAGEPEGKLDVIDAGCGTGLLGPYLRPYARRLVGVDLSPKMLEKAAARGGYEELHAAEITAYLAASPQAFDLVAAADTLNYFGELREVLSAARISLRKGGRLVFTLEHAVNEDEVPAGYRIHPDGRYMHAEPYVRSALAAAGFDSTEIQYGVLRREGDAYVPGLVVAARAAAAGIFGRRAY